MRNEWRTGDARLCARGHCWHAAGAARHLRRRREGRREPPNRVVFLLHNLGTATTACSLLCPPGRCTKSNMYAAGLHARETLVNIHLERPRHCTVYVLTAVLLCNESLCSCQEPLCVSHQVAMHACLGCKLASSVAVFGRAAAALIASVCCRAAASPTGAAGDLLPEPPHEHHLARRGVEPEPRVAGGSAGALEGVAERLDRSGAAPAPPGGGAVRAVQGAHGVHAQGRALRQRPRRLQGKPRQANCIKLEIVCPSDPRKLHCWAIDLVQQSMHATCASIPTMPSNHVKIYVGSGYAAA